MSIFFFFNIKLVEYNECKKHLCIGLLYKTNCNTNSARQIMWIVHLFNKKVKPLRLKCINIFLLLLFDLSIHKK